LNRRALLFLYKNTTVKRVLKLPMLQKIPLLILFIILSLFGCKDSKTHKTSDSTTAVINETNSYAKGFQIKKLKTHTLLEILNPWPNAEKSFKYLIVTENQLKQNSFSSSDYDAIITVPINKIVVTSTTHIPSLELLNMETNLIGFPGTDYISSEKTRLLIDKGIVRELGKNEGINTEVLIDLNPDIVVGFGIDGNNKSFETLKNSGIPILYNGDWVESSPLAKAEWIKFFGVLFNKEHQADSIFNSIEKDYLKAKKEALNIKFKPTVLSGAMHKDVWYLPSGNSPEAQLLKDANVNYLWSETNGNGSLALSFETVFNTAQHANIWISPSYYATLNDLKKANEHYTTFDAYKNNAVFTFSNTKGKTGGVLYYELGIARPDLVLKDLIKICHPELLEDYQPYFFKPLK
jgi:iron complex transport system substrate-binding protein